MILDFKYETLLFFYNHVNMESISEKHFVSLQDSALKYFNCRIIENQK